VTHRWTDRQTDGLTEGTAIAIAAFNTLDARQKANLVRRHFRAFIDDAARDQATDILNELDWCLDQLERIQTHRSVSNMTTDKV